MIRPPPTPTCDWNAKGPNPYGWSRLVAVGPPAGLPVESDRELERLFLEAYHRLHGRMPDHAERFLDRESARDAAAAAEAAAAEAAADVRYRWHLLRPEQRTDAYCITALNHSVIAVLGGHRSRVALEDGEEELERRAGLAMEWHSRGDTAADVLEREYIIRW